MKVFVAHRTNSRNAAKQKLKLISDYLDIKLIPIFLSESRSSDWKKKGEKEIQAPDMVLVFDPDACADSENVRWEIQESKRQNKKLLELKLDTDIGTISDIIRRTYEFQDEFDALFNIDHDNQSDRVLELYTRLEDTNSLTT